MQHVALTLWIMGTPYKPRRFWFMQVKRDTLEWGHPDIAKTGCPKIYAEVAQGATGRERVVKALYRDFRLSDRRADIGQMILCAIYALRPSPRSFYFQADTRLDRALAYRSIAACRSRLCLFDKTDFSSCRDYFAIELAYLLLS